MATENTNPEEGKPEGTYPPEFKPGQTISMKLREEDIKHLNRLFKGLKGRPTTQDVLRHCVAYTRKNQFFG